MIEVNDPRMHGECEQSLKCSLKKLPLVTNRQALADGNFLLDQTPSIRRKYFVIWFCLSEVFACIHRKNLIRLAYV